MADKVTPGQITNRAEMKKIFGGGTQSGIEPCRKTPTVLIYSDPATGEASGYIDGWLPENDEHGPLFEYTGHGQADQVFTGANGTGNRAILQHLDQGRLLRVFRATGNLVGNSAAKEQRYVGVFELDAELTYVVRQRPNRHGVMRRVIVFRLRPCGPYEKLPEDTLAPSDATNSTVVPADVTTSSIVEPEVNKKRFSERSGALKIKVERREAKLSNQFRAFMVTQGHSMKRFQLQVEGTASSLLTDLYDETAHVLYEVKGTNSREAVRMAIGQLLDYRRHVQPPNPVLAVLLPQAPHSDLKALLSGVGIALVYWDGEKFIGVPGVT